MADTWDAYEAAYKAIREPMGAFVKAIAQEFGTTADEDIYSEDYGWRTNITCNGVLYFAELQLWDASAYGDAEAGEKGNLHLSVCREGGQIVVAWAPHNYTDECWTDYSNIDELRSRVPSLFEAHTVANSIRQDSGEA